MATNSEWQEALHPRGEGGRFTAKGVKAARAALKAGKLGVQRHAEPYPSAASGKRFHRSLEVEAQRIHPDELHRLRDGDEGGVYLDPDEKLELLDSATGRMEMSSFNKALSTIASFSRRPDDKVSIVSPHGFSFTRTRRQWGEILRSLPPDTGFSEWFDVHGGTEPGEPLPEGKPGTFVHDPKVWGGGTGNQGSLFYAKDSAECKWITVGAVEGEDGRRHGGSPVCVKGGRIIKGHPSLAGRKIDALHEPAEHGSHRQQLATSREYERAKWRKNARAEGIHPADLDHLAVEIKTHADAFAADRRQMLQEARKMSKAMGYGDLRAITLHRGRGHLDADAVRGLDDIAQSMASSYPEQFPGRDDATQQLFEALNAGDPQPMSQDDAYREALDHLAVEAAKWRLKPGEAIPFARELHPVRKLAGPLRRP